MKITEKQKLQAIDFKYYQHQKWTPKLNDFYTLTRHSYFGVEVFQIVLETETQFGIKKVWDDLQSYPYQSDPSMHDKKGFTDEGFGLCRVHIPEWITK